MQITGDSSQSIPLTEQLDAQSVNEIVADVYQRKGLTTPYKIEFERKSSMDSKPEVHLQEESLHIVASVEPELRRLIGRFVLEQSWTPHEWLLTNHVWTYTAISMILVLTLPVISFSMAFLFFELRLGLVAITVAGVVIFCVWAGHKVSITSVYLLKKLTLEMVELGCMTEYDSKDYEGDPHKAAIAGAVICLWGGLVSGAHGMSFPTLTDFIFIFSLVPTGIAAVYYMFSAISRFIDVNLCFESEDYDEESMDEEEYNPWAEYEENEYLQAEFTDLVERLKLKDSLVQKHESEFHSIRAGYSETEYAHCRWAYDFVEDETLYIYCRDVSEAAARRYGTGLLVRGSLHFYSELSTKRRAIYLIAFFFGLIMMIPILFGAWISNMFGYSSLIFTGIVYSAMWNIGRKQNETARRELSTKLKEAGEFNEFEFEFYKRKMFTISQRYDWMFLIGFLMVLLVIGLGIFAFS